MHFAPLGPTSNDMSRWSKEKAFRLRILCDISPLPGDYDSSHVDGIIDVLECCHPHCHLRALIKCYS